MANCKNHPQTESVYFCSKYKYNLCQACLRCSDPQIYCKFRTSCVIHFLEKEKKIDSLEGRDEHS